MPFARNHQKVSALADGADTSLIRPSDWNAALAVSGATVGGIPYCPTATTETTSSGLTFNAGGAAGEGLAIAAGTATTNVNALSVTQEWNSSGVAFKGIRAVFTDTASGAGSSFLEFLSGSTSVLSASKSGIGAITSIWGDAGLIIAAGGYGNAVLRAVSAGSMFWYTDGQTLGAHWSGTSGASKMKFDSKTTLGFTASQDDPTGSMDSAISRLSAGVLGVGTGAAGNSSGTIQGKHNSSDGSAGVTSFGPSAVASITVKDGIIVAIS